MPEPSYVPYTDDVEVEQPNEAADIDETIALMQHTMEQTFEIHRHATTATHAKSHGVLTGVLGIDADLAPELAQGLFAEPASHDVVLRFASEPGQIDDDREKRARGAALKVLGVQGEMLREGWPSQDFLFNTWPVIGQGDVHTYLQAIRQRDEHVGHVNRVRAGTLAHHPSRSEMLFDSTPNISPVAHSYYSQGAFRHGDWVAKYALIPTTQPQLDLSDTEVGKDDGPAALQQMTSSYFAEHEARFDLCVQLCVDLEQMPVEDASEDWSQELSPYRRVGEVVLPAQESFSPARRVYAEDSMTWRPWYSLAAHRPLGSINRVRRRAYEELAEVRFQTNAGEATEPHSLADVPD